MPVNTFSPSTVIPPRLGHVMQWPEASLTCTRSGLTSNDTIAPGLMLNSSTLRIVNLLVIRCLIRKLGQPSRQIRAAMFQPVSFAVRRDPQPDPFDGCTGFGVGRSTHEF